MVADLQRIAVTAYINDMIRAILFYWRDEVQMR